MAEGILEQQRALSEQLANSVEVVKVISKAIRAECDREKEAACSKLQQELTAAKSDNANLRSLHSTETEKLLTLKLTAQHKVAMEKLHAAQLKLQHLNLAEARGREAALARRQNDSQLFKYSIRGGTAPLQCGSVPLSIFQAEPDSALAHTYSETENMSCKDEEGRVVVNSDPQNWPIILNWLSFGTVPENVSTSLMSELRFWRLDKLIAAINAECSSDDHANQAGPDSHNLHVAHVTIDGNVGFSVSGMIHQLPKLLSAADTRAKCFKLPFSAAGRGWYLGISQERCSLVLSSGPALTSELLKIDLGTGACAVSLTSRKLLAFDGDDNSDWGMVLTSDEVQRLMHPRALSNVEDGSLQFAVTITFK